jgi:hypothetical protein
VLQADRREEGFTVITCPECGAHRTVSHRQSRRKITICKDCSSGKRESLSQRYMRFWLTRYRDEEIAELASGVWGVRYDPGHVARRRKELL